MKCVTRCNVCHSTCHIRRLPNSLIPYTFYRDYYMVHTTFVHKEQRFFLNTHIFGHQMNNSFHKLSELLRRSWNYPDIQQDRCSLHSHAWLRHSWSAGTSSSRSLGLAENRRQRPFLLLFTIMEGKTGY